jgi:hypothetical protein
MWLKTILQNSKRIKFGELDIEPIKKRPPLETSDKEHLANRIRGANHATEKQLVRNCGQRNKKTIF